MAKSRTEADPERDPRAKAGAFAYTRNTDERTLWPANHFVPRRVHPDVRRIWNRDWSEGTCERGSARAMANPTIRSGTRLDGACGSEDFRLGQSAGRAVSGGESEWRYSGLSTEPGQNLVNQAISPIRGRWVRTHQRASLASWNGISSYR